MDSAAGFDPQDPYSRDKALIPPARRRLPSGFRFGVPAADRLNFFHDPHSEAVYRKSIERMEALGGKAVIIDFAPFQTAGGLLYDGPWVAERLAGLREFIAEAPESLLPLTRDIIQSGRRFDAVAAFDGMNELRALKRLAANEWKKMDVLLLPTAGTIYTRAEVEADPLRRNSNLATYTTFVNLLDLCAVALPAGFIGDGMPMSVSLIAPAGYEQAILDLGGRLHRNAGVGTGAGKYELPPEPKSTVDSSQVRLAVVGAHLTGQPLNSQLTALNARLAGTFKTAANYCLYALANTRPPKPGLVRATEAGKGAAVEVEVWEMTPDAFGRFVAAIPSPMGICSLRLETGEEVKGFTCEPWAIVGATDITQFGGWRKYLASL
jgi:allophanate hydrolase